MIDSASASARRTSRMIGQEEALSSMTAAVSPGDDSFQVVLVRAPGGIGKTRLLEEVLQRFGPVEDTDVWRRPLVDDSAPIVADLVDVIDTRLHDAYRFVTALRHNLRPYDSQLDFGRFDASETRVRLVTDSGAQLDAIDSAQRDAVEAFISDLARITLSRRVVFLVDTAERLSYLGSEWLLEQGLLMPADLQMRTHHWLQRFIGDSRLKNVTLVLAGRGAEGSAFFGRVERTVRELADPTRRLADIHLRRFSLNETRTYFEQLAADHQDNGPAITNHFALVADPRRDVYKVIGLYTHGIPVRLALYAQLLAAGKTVHGAFKRSYAEACRNAGLDAATVDLNTELPNTATPGLQQIQWEVEEEFINLLFRNPTDPYTQVLTVLVRAPRGLTAEQLHFVLDALPGTSAATWQEAVRKGEQSHLDRLQELRRLLDAIANSYLGKRRAAVEAEAYDWETGEALCVGLQDESYRIYAEHMGLLAQPVSAGTAIIRDSLDSANRQRYEQNWEDELNERRQLYGKLADLADAEYRRLLEMKRANLQEDERRFEVGFRLEDTSTYKFPLLPLVQEGERRRLRTALTFFEIERMVYRLLQDPERNLNMEYITLEDDNARAARQEEDFLAQAEVWRTVHDDWLMKFASHHERMDNLARGEPRIEVMRRFMAQENVARWIKRLVLRGSSQRAVEFANTVRTWIHNMPRGRLDGSEQERQEYSAWRSWNHTLADAERIIWTQVAYIRLGWNVAEATEEIGRQIARLEPLYEADDTHVIYNSEGHAERGFAPGTDAPAHPAYTRVGRLLSHAHTQLGYGWRTLGHMHKAVIHYAQALEYVRGDSGPLQAHRAMLLNNLARALSDMGHNGVPVCLDGLELRWETAEEVPLASSYNTLALIYDEVGRYEDAALLAAKAIAYSHWASEPRQLGLSLRQMATTLRHLAGRLVTGQRTGIPAETYFGVAEDLLSEARSIFEDLKQAERLVEVYLEMGCLYRDRLNPQFTHPDARQRKHTLTYEVALEHLHRAERQAREHWLAQHVLDARVNLARTHYYAGYRDEALQTLDAIDADEQYQVHRIWPDYMPGAGDDTLRDRNWISRHLATVEQIRGWLAFDDFQGHVERVTLQRQGDAEEKWWRHAAVTVDPTTQDSIRRAAKAYALAVAYAQLGPRRDHHVSQLQGDLYQRLRRANRTELQSFAYHLRETRMQYPMLSSVPFLLEFLDMFLGPEKTVNGAIDGDGLHP